MKQRQAAIVGIARAVADKRIALHGGADVAATVAALKELPGIGDWTAQYIAMRALRWPDAFPAGDVALHKALGVQQDKHPARAAEAASQAWKPWRSYAVIRAWASSSSPCDDASLPFSAMTSFSSARNCSCSAPTRPGTSAGVAFSAPARPFTVPSSCCR